MNSIPPAALNFSQPLPASARLILAFIALGALSVTSRAVVITNPIGGLDVNGNQNMQADTGCIVKTGGSYYWFGRDGTALNKIRCYTSPDLVMWDAGSVMLTGTSGEVARPRVYWNSTTNKWVMTTMCRYNDVDLGQPKGTYRNVLRIYTSSNIHGPYTRVGSTDIRPNNFPAPPGAPWGSMGATCGMIGSFETTGTNGSHVYIISNADYKPSDGSIVQNKTTVISTLTDDYTGIAAYNSWQCQSADGVTLHEGYSGFVTTDYSTGAQFLYIMASDTRGWDCSRTMYKTTTLWPGGGPKFGLLPTSGGDDGAGWLLEGWAIDATSGKYYDNRLLSFGTQNDFQFKITDTPATKEQWVSIGDDWGSYPTSTPIPRGGHGNNSSSAWFPLTWGSPHPADPNHAPKPILNGQQDDSWRLDLANITWYP